MLGASEDQPRNAESDTGTDLGGDVLVVAADPRTGLDVVGRVKEHTDDSVMIDPRGPVYSPGAFWAEIDDVSIFEDMTDGERERALTRWDIVCLVFAGGLDKLDADQLQLISSWINEGHV